MPKKSLRPILSLEERKLIEQYAKTSLSGTAIAHLLGRSKNCISTEYRKNGGRDKYQAVQAQEKAELKKQERIATISQPLSLEQRETIKKGIAERWPYHKIEKEANTSISRIKTFLSGQGIQTYQQKILSKIESLEMQIEILFDQIKKLTKN